jgi:hypothetical protein
MEQLHSQRVVRQPATSGWITAPLMPAMNMAVETRVSDLPPQPLKTPVSRSITLRKRAWSAKNCLIKGSLRMTLMVLRCSTARATML